MFINKNLLAKFIKKIYLLIIKLFIRKENSIFVFQNIDDLNVFKKYKILNNVKTEIIRGSGVDTNVFKKKNVTKVYDLIFHSRLIYDKGILELIGAIEELKKDNLVLNVLILGNPDKQNRSSIKKEQINNWSKKKLILWKPKVKNVLPYIQKSKISILPSYREGLPKCLLEAASCARPIVATDVPGCREVVLHGKTGLLVKAKNKDSLVIALSKLLADSNLRKEMGEKGREMVLKEFSEDLISNQVSEVWRQVLN